MAGPDELETTGLPPGPASSWWSRRALRHLVVGVGFLVLAAVVLAFAVAHTSALRSVLVAAWAVVGVAFLVDAYRHRPGDGSVTDT